MTTSRRGLGEGGEVISLLFFNFYLKHVFQIKHVTPQNVGISDADAQSIWTKVKDKVRGESAKEEAQSREEFLRKFEDILNRDRGEKPEGQQGSGGNVG